MQNWRMRIRRMVALCLAIVCSFIIGCAGSSFNSAKEKNTIVAYDQFLREYGESEFAPKAKKLREELVFTKAKKGKNISDYDYYLREYPKGTYVVEVKKLKEEFVFNEAKERDSISDYDGYLRAYPQGRFVSEVRELKEKKVFKEAKERDSISDYDNYLRAYPQGRFVSEVRELKEKKVFKEKKEKEKKVFKEKKEKCRLKMSILLKQLEIFPLQEILFCPDLHVIIIPTYNEAHNLDCFENREQQVRIHRQISEHLSSRDCSGISKEGGTMLYYELSTLHDLN